MRIFKCLSTVVLSASLLVACGGGGSGETTTNLSITGEALYASYDKINRGMNYSQVRDIVGFEASIKPLTADKFHVWKNESTSLSAHFDASSGLITSKHMDGPPRGSASTAYR
jgi:hypothetical protein